MALMNFPLALRGATRKQLDSLRGHLKEQGFGLIAIDDDTVHSYPYDSPWLDDAEFNVLYERVRAHTLVDRARCYSLYLLAQQVASLPGDVLEVGTWRGGTGTLLAMCLRDKAVFLADTFCGVVKSEEWEHYEDTAHNDTSESMVTTLSESLGLANVTLLPGVFPDETGAIIAGRTISMVHLDLDVYRSTVDAFNHVWPSVTPGGIVVFDDYGMTSACAGISRFVNEIRDDADKLFVQNMNGQAYIIKCVQGVVQG